MFRPLFTMLLGLLWTSAYASYCQKDMTFKNFPDDLQRDIVLFAIYQDSSELSRYAQVSRLFREVFENDFKKRSRFSQGVFRRCLIQRILNERCLIEDAIRAGLENRDSPYSGHVLEVELQGLELFIQSREKNLLTSEDWYKHGLSLMAAWSALFNLAQEGLEESLKKSAGKVFEKKLSFCSFYEIWHRLIYAEEIATDKKRQAEQAREIAAECTDRASWKILAQVMCFSADCPWQELLDTTALEIAENFSISLQSKAALAVSDALECEGWAADQRGRVAYCVAQTVLWHNLLVSELKVFETAYDSSSEQLGESLLLQSRSVSCQIFDIYGKRLENLLNGDSGHSPLSTAYAKFMLENLSRIQNQAARAE